MVAASKVSSASSPTLAKASSPPPSPDGLDYFRDIDPRELLLPDIEEEREEALELCWYIDRGG